MPAEISPAVGKPRKATVDLGKVTLGYLMQELNHIPPSLLTNIHTYYTLYYYLPALGMAETTSAGKEFYLRRRCEILLGKKGFYILFAMSDFSFTGR